MYTETESDSEPKKFFETTISIQALEEYVAKGWKEIDRRTNVCGVFVVIQREIRGKL